MSVKSLIQKFLFKDEKDHDKSKENFTNSSTQTQLVSQPKEISTIDETKKCDIIKDAERKMKEDREADFLYYIYKEF